MANRRVIQRVTGGDSRVYRASVAARDAAQGAAEATAEDRDVVAQDRQTVLTKAEEVEANRGLVAAGAAAAANSVLLAQGAADAAAQSVTNTVLAEQLAASTGELGPLIGLAEAVLFDQAGGVLSRQLRNADVERARQGTLVTESQRFAELENATGQVQRATLEVGPLIGLASDIEFDAAGAVLSMDDRLNGERRAIGGALQRTTPILARAGVATTLPDVVFERDRAGEVGPLIGLADDIAFNLSGRVTRMTRRDVGPMLALNGSLQAERDLLAGLNSTPQLVYNGLPDTGAGVELLPGFGISVPPGNVNLIIIGYGQSYRMNAAEDYLSTTALYGNLNDIPNAFMPSVGVHPGNTDFSAFVPLRSLSTVSVPLEIGEPPTIEMGRVIAEMLAATGLPDLPRVIVAGHGAGGKSIQHLGRGSDYYQTLMDIVRRIANASRAEGRIPIVYAVDYLQGEGNRSGAFFAYRSSWVSHLSTLRRHLDVDIRAITGQTETVVLSVSPITRTSSVANVSLGAVDAALLEPSVIVCGGPNYGILHATDNHPSLVGARQLGRLQGRAIMRNVLGLTQRICRVLRWWMETATELRFEVEMPYGATAMVLDTSGEIVSMTSMDVGLGWRAADKDSDTNPLQITSVAVNVPAHPGGAASLATCSITFNRAPDEGSLRCTYANSSSGIGGGLGGSLDGPRGCFRANDVEIVPDMPIPVYSWLQPAELAR